MNIDLVQTSGNFTQLIPFLKCINLLDAMLTEVFSDWIIVCSISSIYVTVNGEKSHERQLLEKVWKNDYGALNASES